MCVCEAATERQCGGATSSILTPELEDSVRKKI